MNDEGNIQPLEKEGTSRFLTDATIMGSTPRLNLERVYDDPYLIKAKEKRIISLSDQITQLTRDNTTETYRLALKRRILNLRTHELKRKDNRMKKRDYKESQQEKQYYDSQDLKQRAEDKKQSSKVNFEKTKNAFEEAMNNYSDYLKSEDEKNAGVDPTSSLESFIPDFTQEGDQQAELEERIYIISQMKEKVRTIAKLRQNLRSSKLHEYVYDTEFAAIHCTKNILKIQVSALQERLAKANQRYDEASKKKANPYDPVHFEEGIIEQIEKAADEAEKRLNRSRVDAIEYDLQHEFSSYQALKDENKKRAESLKAQKAQLEQAKAKQQHRSRIIQKMTPKKKEDHTETAISIVSQSSTSIMSPEKRMTLNNVKQDEINKANTLIDDLERRNKASRVDTEKEYYQSMEMVQLLNSQVLQSEEDYVKLCNFSNQVDKLRLKERETAQQLAKLTNTKQKMIYKVKTAKGKEQYDDRAKNIEANLLKIKAKENDLQVKRNRIAKEKTIVEDLRKSVNDAESRKNEAEKRIAEINKNIMASIDTIEDYSNYMNSIHLNVYNLMNREEEQFSTTEEQQ